MYTIKLSMILTMDTFRLSARVLGFEFTFTGLPFLMASVKLWHHSDSTACRELYTVMFHDFFLCRIYKLLSSFFFELEAVYIVFFKCIISSILKQLLHFMRYYQRKTLWFSQDLNWSPCIGAEDKYQQGIYNQHGLTVWGWNWTVSTDVPTVMHQSSCITSITWHCSSHTVCIIRTRKKKACMLLVLYGKLTY